jgi:site-specific recombinase XerD
MHLMNGEDLVTLQRQLGHSQITVTQQYIGNVAGAQIKAHRETSPLKSLGIRLGDRKSR